MMRGEVWWADLPLPTGRRPVVLLSRDSAYAVRDLIIVTQVSRRVRGIPTEVPLGREDGLPQEGAANVDVINTMPRNSLLRRIAILSPEKLAALDTALHFALGLGE